MQPFRPEVTARLVELAPRLLDQLDDMTDRMIEVLQRTEPATSSSRVSCSWLPLRATCSSASHVI